jgi:hypothetical protein
LSRALHPSNIYFFPSFFLSHFNLVLDFK